MGRSRITIEVSPSRLELVARQAGGQPQRRTLRSDKTDWGQPWPACLESLAPTLRQWVQELRISGMAADVCYGPGSAVAGVFSCPAGTGAAGAENSSLLALQELASFAVRTSPNDCAVLRTDGSGVEKRLHTLAAADSAEHLRLVAGFVTSAGLTVDALRPADACALAETMQAAAVAPADATRLSVWMTDHATVLACVSRGRLRFIRTVALGMESLVDGLCRPLRSRTNPEPIVLTRSAARECLCTHGIPAASTVIDETAGLSGACVLPVLQPALQRLGVEIKQSLRFGLDETARPAAALTLHGPGAAVPGLSTAIAAQSGLTEVPVPGAGDRAAATDWLQSAAPSIVLLPGETLERRTSGRLRLAVRAGVCAAGLAVAGLGFEAFSRLDGLRSRVQAAEARAESQRQAREQAEAVFAARAATAAMTRQMREALGSSPEWNAVMRLVSESTPPEIRLGSLDLRLESDGAAAALVGSVRIGDDKAFADLLKNYTDALGACPMVRGVKMGATSRVELNGTAAHRFELTVLLVSLPYDTGLASGGDER